jgi:hypothetical protein
MQQEHDIIISKHSNERTTLTCLDSNGSAPEAVHSVNSKEPLKPLLSLTNRMIKRIIRSLILIVLAIIAGLYGINAAILFFAQPANLQEGAREEVSSQYGTVSVVLLNDLKAGGLGNLASDTDGYVNVLSSARTVYLNGTTFKTVPAQNSYLYQHEFAHILQKELIAQKVGGYPSISNPFVSFSYYGELLKLNQDFAAIMPKGNQDAQWHSLFSGLEIGADCFAQPNTPDEALTYVGTDFCSPEQHYISRSMLINRWPAPLTDQQKNLFGISTTGTAQMQESR